MSIVRGRIAAQLCPASTRPFPAAHSVTYANHAVLDEISFSLFFLSLINLKRLEFGTVEKCATVLDF